MDETVNDFESKAPPSHGPPPSAGANVPEIGPEARLEEDEILDLLGSLVEKSLVQFEETQNGGRYRLLETVHQYASEKLDLSSGRDTLKRRHHAYFADLGSQADLRGPHQRQWLHVVEADLANFRTAIHAGIGLPDALEPTLVLASGISRYFQTSGHLGEGIELLEKLLETAEGAPPSTGLASTQSGLGVLYWVRGQVDQSLALHKVAAESFLAIGDHRRHALVITNMGTICLASNDLAKARELLERGLSLQLAGGDGEGAAATRLNLGHLLIQLEDFEAARPMLEGAIADWRERGNAHAVAVGLNNLATVLRETGQLDKAGAVARESLELRSSHKDQHGMCLSFEGIARLAMARGEFAVAATLLSAADAHRNRSGMMHAPSEKEAIKKDWDLIASQLSDLEQSEARLNGQSLPVEAAVRLALTVAAGE